MAHKPEVVAGIAWFRADQWPLLRSLATDAEDLEETHEEWVKIAEETIEDLARMPRHIFEDCMKTPNQSLEPTAGSRTERLKDKL